METNPKKLPGYFDALEDYPKLYKHFKGRFDDLVVEIAENVLGNGDPYAAHRKFSVPKDCDQEFDDLAEGVDNICFDGKKASMKDSRNTLIKLASNLPKGDESRRFILGHLVRMEGRLEAYAVEVIRVLSGEPEGIPKAREFQRSLEHLRSHMLELLEAQNLVHQDAAVLLQILDTSDDLFDKNGTQAVAGKLVNALVKYRHALLPLNF